MRIKDMGNGKNVIYITDDSKIVIDLLQKQLLLIQEKMFLSLYLVVVYIGVAGRSFKQRQNR